MMYKDGNNPTAATDANGGNAAVNVHKKIDAAFGIADQNNNSGGWTTVGNKASAAAANNRNASSPAGATAGAATSSPPPPHPGRVGGGGSSSVAASSSSSSQHVKFQFLNLIGGGSFGDIYSGVDPRNKEKVAIKVESKTVRNPQLYLEYGLYRRHLSGLTGFPSVWHYSQTRGHNYFAMTLLGENLEALFEKCGRRWSPKTLLMLAVQLIARLEVMHDRSGHLHRDIKPENLIMGQEGGPSSSTLHLIDLGLAKPFRDAVTREHIVQRKIRKSLTGTARYASVNAHFGRDQSRRDDMESAGYVLVYFGKGRLPWQGLKASNKKQRYEKICEVKQATTVPSLCQGLMPEMRLYLEYVKKLTFVERPDYGLLKGMFMEVLEARGEQNDGVFDWMSPAAAAEDGAGGSAAAAGPASAMEE